mmetsp:Transcript_2352/g.3932  ORF Transcript_2352/g.3932 Transcript_2352/m.3932 type:complete len:704 (+) Transcript_2352:669-2780(+)
MVASGSSIAIGATLECYLDPTPEPTPSPSGTPKPTQSPSISQKPTPQPSPAPSSSFSPSSVSTAAWNIKCQYIYILSGGDVRTINLAEVQAFGPGGTAVTPVSATLSTTYSGYPASYCIDGSTSNFCHSGEAGGPEWLEIDLGSRQRVTSIVVSNRAGYTDRIVDGTIGLYTQSGGAGGSCGSWTFEEDAASYTFDSAFPTAAPSSPTPTISSLPTTSFLPSSAPTESCHPITISASSNGGSSISVTFEDGSSTGFSMSHGRGLNVAMFAGVSHQVLSTATYDTYSDVSAQATLIAALEAAPDGTIVVMAARDEASNNLQSESRTTISNLLGAALLGDIAFRSRYAIIAIKGNSKPKDEALDADGTSISVSSFLECYLEPSLAPSVSAAPAPNPTSQPTPLPTPANTRQPTPLPTLEPIFQPTPFPTLKPTYQPTPLPTRGPTFEPTPLPTPEPTLQPTAGDTFLVAVSLGLTATDDRDLTAAVIFPAVASTINGVEAADLTNFRVLSTSGFTRRRRRSLLGTASIGFDVQVSLGATSASSPAAYTAALAQNFTNAVDSGALSTSVASNCNFGTAAATASTLETVVRTPSPVPNPTGSSPAPKLATPSTLAVPANEKEGSDDGLLSASIFVYAFVAVGAVLGLAAVVMAYRKYSPRGGKYDETSSNSGSIVTPESDATESNNLKFGHNPMPDVKNTKALSEML